VAANVVSALGALTAGRYDDRAGIVGILLVLGAGLLALLPVKAPPLSGGKATAAQADYL
jgi:hypothetical protein